MFVVMFNGPPKCGKDSIATALADLLDNESDLPVKIDHFIRPLREAAMQIAGYDPKDFIGYNRIKDVKLPLLNGSTLRELMIHLSENSLKSRYGKDFWGRKLALDNKLSPNMPGILLVPDLGFRDEGRFVTHLVPSIVVHVAREGVDWANDSRRYVSDIAPTVHLSNDGLILDAALRVVDEMRKLGWQF